ncbi:LPXTG cell wall anchor domain-containing protein [Flexibacterium corallicola]|uniref:LPXTG cell wall anchor domain-containing protein n=1 Tax=Flexibacterium corallicola TaxID=3037259 RepID=UPI00286ED758|nr:LPXTG cell wall anchor domain-containing protein [Pseudovibrio sp. M1P-2-3]
MKNILLASIFSLALIIGFAGLPQSANAYDYCQEPGYVADNPGACGGGTGDAPVLPIAAGIGGLAVLAGGLFIALRRRKGSNKS